MIMDQNENLNIYLELYEQTKDKTKLILSLKDLCISHEYNANVSDDEHVPQNTITSPEDSALISRKKNRKSNIDRDNQNMPQMFGNQVQSCEEGLSPKVSFTKNKAKNEFDSDES